VTENSGSRFQGLSDGDERQPGALNGVRVIELADWIAGPYAGSLLADFGADVIIVERPQGLSGTRQLGGMHEGDTERSPYFCVFARNKRSVTLDFTSSEGRDLLLELVERCDVVVCSFKPGVLERRDLGWDTLSARNPRLVLLEISGFGQTGLLRDYASFDRVAQAFGGMTYVTGHPETPPTRAGLGVADFVSGLYGAFGVLVALEERRRSGLGQRIDHALYESLLPMGFDIPIQFALRNEVRERSGNYFPGYAPGETFQSADETWIHISATGDRAFEVLMNAIDRPDLVSETRFDSMKNRDTNREELHDIIRAWVRSRGIEEVETKLMSTGVAMARIQSIKEIMSHPHVLERRDFENCEHPSVGTIPAVAPLPRLSRTPGRIDSIGPGLGANTAEVFCGLLGLNEKRLEQLHALGIV
jgi:crotonobetainyl-CoA:carnitine CoA-transferase CaiB-like acyl-CoA transferase